MLAGGAGEAAVSGADCGLGQWDAELGAGELLLVDGPGGDSPVLG